MAFFDDFTKILGDTGKLASDKAKNIKDVIQLKSKISSERDKLNKAYIVLGKAYYNMLNEEDATYGSYVKVIDNTRTNIKVLEAELREIEGTRTCPECGAKLEKDAKYCGNCGAVITETGE